MHSLKKSRVAILFTTFASERGELVLPLRRSGESELKATQKMAMTPGGCFWFVRPRIQFLSLVLKTYRSLFILTLFGFPPLLTKYKLKTMKFATTIKKIEVLALSTALLSSSVWNIGVEAQRKLKGEFGTRRLQRELMGSSKSSKMKTSSSSIEEENMDLAECPERIESSTSKSKSKSKSKDMKEVCPNEGIIITEVMYNPATSQLADNVGEWVEILNYGCTDVDLTGWEIDDGEMRDALSLTCGADAVLSPGEYALIIQGGTDGQVLNEYGSAIPDGTKVFSTSNDDIGNMLSNTADEVILFDSNGTEIQRLEYDDGGSCGTAADGDGYSLERAWPDRDPACGNFISREVQSLGFPVNGTPGQQNNIWFGRSGDVFDDCECTVE